MVAEVVLSVPPPGTSVDEFGLAVFHMPGRGPHGRGRHRGEALEPDGNIGNSCPGPRPILDWVHLESTDTQTDHARVERRSRLFTRPGHAAACSGYTSITYSSSVENFGDMSSGPPRRTTTISCRCQDP